MSTTISRSQRRLERCDECGGYVGATLWDKYDQVCPLCGIEREVPDER